MLLFITSPQHSQVQNFGVAEHAHRLSKMSVIGNTESIGQPKERRTRRTHAKVKTGCLTCKWVIAVSDGTGFNKCRRIRKKKCDETKPACLRCTTTGRKCDGYEPISPPCSSISSSSEKERRFLQSTAYQEALMEHEFSQRPLKRQRTSGFPIFSSVIRSPPSLSFDSDIEAKCFDYFRFCTGPQFACYFDSGMWRNFIIKAAFQHPVVLQAAAAVGAVHRRFGFGLTREAFEYCEIANNLQRKALKSMHDFEKEGGASSREVLMIASMLLGLFEGFQSNYEAAVHHMTAGLRKLLHRPTRIVHSESRYSHIEMKPDVFRQLYHRIYCRAVQLFGSEAHILCYPEDGKSLPDIPNIFESLEQARDLLFTEVEWILHAPTRLLQDPVARCEVQNMHVSRLLRWSVAYAETIRQWPERSSREKRACMLLKLTRNITYLLLYLVLFVLVDSHCQPIPEIDLQFTEEDEDFDLAIANSKLWNLIQRREELKINLGRVHFQAQSIIDENSIFGYEESCMNLDSGIGPPRLARPGPESSAKTRHLVKSLLNRTQGEDKMWEILGVYGIAERLSAIEEHAVIAAIKEVIPEDLDPKWVDLNCFLDERRMLLRYCRPDGFGLGTIWTQEWLVF